LYLKLSLWSLLTLVCSIGAFVATNMAVNRNFNRRAEFLPRLAAWQLRTAIHTYERGGAAELRELLQAWRSDLNPEQYLVDAQGRDLLTGEDRSAMLAEGMERVVFPPVLKDNILMVRRSADGRYAILTKLDGPPFGGPNVLPYFAVILVAIGLFSYALFRYLVSPVRQLALAVERFGQGDFSARVDVRRNDEFGVLADRFNEMAERIQTLLGAQRRLLEDVSHELRSPLARMQYALELLRTAAEPEAGLNRMRKEIDRLSMLVSELVEVTRAEGDPLARQRENVDLAQLAREVVEVCGIEAEAKGCRLELDTESDVRREADRELLWRAIENIIRNAIRHSPQDASVSIAVRTQAKQAVLTVRDRGAGVPEELLQRIFEPFFRVDDSRSSRTGGLGLGLAIARRAIALHEGELTAANAIPGLLVEIRLPLS
jgi:two-component system sensor histidine kinase CpxA